MRKLFTITCSLFAIAAIAALDVIALGPGEAVEVSRAGKVAAVECFSTVADGTYNPKRETVLMGERLDVTEHAATNYAYYVVTTNSLGASSTNVLSRPHPIPYPPTMTGYWTNATVTAWATTNAVPIVAGTFTNDVEAATWIAPGDRLFCPPGDTFRGRLNIYVER